MHIHTQENEGMAYKLAKAIPSKSRAMVMSFTVFNFVPPDFAQCE